jgi:ligand-binding sensor domain-containing protein/serine phosphatase RsbU (regulator of sigma subunit)
MRIAPSNIFFIVVLIALMLSARVFSSERSINASVFNVEKGLSQSGVNSLLLDSYGFLWIGTQDGLNRYDGYSFKVYRNNPLDYYTLANNNVTSIIEDSNGNIWIATLNGLSIFERERERFQNYFYDPQDITSLSNNRVYSIYQDRCGEIWVKTLESLDRFDPISKSFTRFPHYSDPQTYSSYNDAFNIFEDSQNRFWIGSKDGLLLFDRKNQSFKRYSYSAIQPKSLSHNNVKSIFEDTHQNIWIATERGLNRFNSKDESFDRFYHEQRNLNSIQNDQINVIYEDKNGILWVGTEVGISSFNPITKTLSPNAIFINEERIYTSTVTSIIEDNSNIFWIGTLSGLYKWDRKPVKFNLYSKLPNGENAFSSNFIASVYEDSHGLLWVGTWGAGLHAFDRKSKEVRKYSEKYFGANGIVNDFVHVITSLSNGDMLIGTRNGVQMYDPKKKTFSDYFSQFKINASSVFANNRVYSIKEDKFNNVWFGTRQGLYKFDGKSLESFTHSGFDSSTLSSNEVHCLAVDGDNLWVGTFNGLNKLDIEKKTVTRYFRQTAYSVGELISNDIVCLHIDSRGDLWIGTTSGLHHLSKETNTFSLLTEANGLPHNLIYAIEEDTNGNIWVSTNLGIAVVSQDDYSIKSYSTSDGLQGYEFNIGASFKSLKGEIFFGGTLGLNSFFPDSIKVNRIVPKIAITSFELHRPSGKEEVPIVGRNQVLINQSYSLINIEFAALDFTFPEKNNYMYKLEGIENDWIFIGTKRTATFSNLPEGVYYFKVMGSNSDNVWNDEPLTIKIIVKTAFWKSKIAIWIYLILGIFSLFLFLRARTSMLRRTSRLLRERETTMTEIEFQKEELIVKNKSITDSIHYAKRIQEALLPSEVHFKKILPDSFILYMPKDIVSGDFYWINETQNKIFVAAIDCTGHGVPGAFMSIIGVELLRNITNVLGVNDAAEILNRLDKGVHDTFSKSPNDEAINVKDGMDVSFCVIDKELNALQFAGAFSNLYLIRDSKIIEVKGDRVTVGIGYDPDKPLFKNHDIDIEPDDMIYMFTDGYVDQFGGTEGKKYKFRRFRHLLLSIHKYPLDIQRKYLLGSINEWKGKHEQVDDILIIGIKPDLSCMF